MRTIWSCRQRGPTQRLTSIDKDDLVKIHREQDVEEQNLVSTEVRMPSQFNLRVANARPDNALFLCLRTKPAGPLVRDELVLKAVLFRQVRDEFLLISADLVEHEPRRMERGSFPAVSTAIEKHAR